MKNILFIAYQFPPRSGPGVHRSVNFVKYLREFGYNPIIVTTDESTNNIENKFKDFNLLHSIPEDTKICRISNEKPVKLYNFLLRFRLYYPIWFIFYPLMFDWSVIWALKSIRSVKRLAKENNVSIIYTSSSPFSSWILGWVVKRDSKIKWVADLRDPFTDGYMWKFPTKLHWYYIRRFEKRILSKADKIIVNTPEVKKMFLTQKGFKEEKVTFITNGF